MLLNLVRNVKALAAVTIREQQMVSEALEVYEETVLDGLGLVARTLGTATDARDGRARSSEPARIVFGSDQGLCGTFNQRVADTLEPGSGPLIAVGHRVGRELERREHSVDLVLSTPNDPSGSRRVVGTLLNSIEEWQSGDGNEVVLLHNKAGEVGLEYHPTSVKLLPFEGAWWESLRSRSWTSRSLPVCLACPQKSQRALLRQWMYSTVYKSLAESKLAESGARLETMQSAETNITANLHELERDFRQQRQSMIDAELLDITAGFESIVKE